MNKDIVEVLFVIPARFGSKGLPMKNTKLIAGKPLIAWSIESALQAASKIKNSRVLVSTDSSEIADISRLYGADVPFLRPDHLSDDRSLSIDVALHSIDFIEKEIGTVKYLALIEPTSPQRSAKDLLDAFFLLKEHSFAESIVGISKTESCHPEFLTRIENNLLIPNTTNKKSVTRRQDIDEVYFFEGSLYISKVESLRYRKSFYHENTLGFVMPKWKSFEIDDITDFYIVEHLLNLNNHGVLL